MGITLRRMSIALGAVVAMVAPLATAADATVVTPAAPRAGKLLQVGPITAENGFPAWYRDSNNVRLEQCTAIDDPLCPAPADEIPNPDEPIVFPANFPGEFFYQLDGAELTLTDGSRAVIGLNVEGAFAGDPVTPTAAAAGGEPDENEQPPVVTPTTAPPVTTPPVVTPTTTPPVVTPTTTTTPPAPVTPVAPGAPVIGNATAGNESAIVRWAAPSSDGGTPIYGYEVQALDPETGIVLAVDAADAAARQMTMTGLGNGVPYAFWVRAVNAAGASESSAVSNVVVPTAPGGGTPGGGSTGGGTAGGGSAGGGTPGGGTSGGGSAGGGSTGGGTAPTSGPSTTPTPTSSPTPTPAQTPTSGGGSGSGGGSTTPDPTGTPTPDPSTSTPPVDHRHVPGAPRIGSVSAGKGLAVVRWTAPADNGGSPIRRYEIEVLAGTRRVGPIRTAAASAAQVTITGLSNGTGYRLRVRAVNGIGAGAQSGLSAMVSPRTLPAAPASLTAQPGTKGGKATATLRWTLGSGNGAAVSKARVTAQRLDAKGHPASSATVVILGAGTRTLTFTAPPGVKAGTRYRYSVQQINAVGTGPGRTAYGSVR